MSSNKQILPIEQESKLKKNIKIKLNKSQTFYSGCGKSLYHSILLFTRITNFVPVVLAPFFLT